MRNPFARPRTPHPNAPSVAFFTPGDLFTPGAERFAYHATHANPLYDLGGSGFKAGQLAVFQPPQVWSNYAMPSLPFTGIPVSSYVLQGLTQMQTTQNSEGPVMK